MRLNSSKKKAAELKKVWKRVNILCRTVYAGEFIYCIEGNTGILLSSLDCLDYFLTPQLK